MARKRHASRRRVSAAQRLSKSAELSKIEKLLGEDFESLSQARKALREQSGPIKGKSSYSVRELSSRSHSTLKSFIHDIESHVKEIDALKGNDDAWAAEIYGHKTYRVFNSIEGLAQQLGRYRDLLEEHPRKAIDRIKIVRLTPRARLAWIKQRKEQSEKLLTKRKAKSREFQKIKRKTKKLEKELAEARRVIRKLKRRKKK